MSCHTTFDAETYKNYSTFQTNFKTLRSAELSENGQLATGKILGRLHYIGQSIVLIRCFTGHQFHTNLSSNPRQNRKSIHAKKNVHVSSLCLWVAKYHPSWWNLHFSIILPNKPQHMYLSKMNTPLIVRQNVYHETCIIDDKLISACITIICVNSPVKRLSRLNRFSDNTAILFSQQQ